MEGVVETHLNYAHAIAAETLKKCPPSVDRRDVRSAAELGLVQAAKAYDPSAGVSFCTFAYYRIRGAIYDELRQIYRAGKWVTGPTDDGGTSSNTPTTNNQRTASGTSSRYLVSIQSLPQEPASKSNESPLDGMYRKQQAQQVKTALNNLPEKYRQVLDAYYYSDLSFEEIGRRLGLSKSWVSRIHAKGLRMIGELLDGSATSQQPVATTSNKRHGSSN